MLHQNNNGNFWEELLESSQLGLGNTAGVWRFSSFMVSNNMHITGGNFWSIERDHFLQPAKLSYHNAGCRNICRWHRMNASSGSRRYTCIGRGNATHCSILGATPLYNRGCLSTRIMLLCCNGLESCSWPISPQNKQRVGVRHCVLLWW